MTTTTLEDRARYSLPEHATSVQFRVALAAEDRVLETVPMAARVTIEITAPTLACGEWAIASGCPQDFAFRPTRLVIHGAAGDWIVHDVVVVNCIDDDVARTSTPGRIEDGRSQFAQSGALPGDMFASRAIDSFVSFDTVRTGDRLALVIQYQGAESAPFAATIEGDAAI